MVLDDTNGLMFLRPGHMNWEFKTSILNAPLQTTPAAFLFKWEKVPLERVDMEYCFEPSCPALPFCIEDCVDENSLL